jgi:hypothetical protein
MSQSDSQEENTMRKHTCIPLFLCFLAAFINAETKHPKSVEKSLSSVKILGIEKISESDTMYRNQFPKHNEFEDGLIFTFLIMSKPGEDGYFTLISLKDFSINGTSYEAQTMGRLGRTSWSETVVFNVSDFTSSIRPDLPELFVPEHKRSVVMVSAIMGMALPETGKLKTAINVGWDKETEEFVIEADIEKLGTGSTSSMTIK